MNSRRLALARLAGEFFPTLLMRGSVRTFDRVSGVPEGAVLLHVSLGSDARTCTCVFEHPDFDPVPAGGRIPALALEMKKAG